MADTLTANDGVNRKKLFWLSCIALIVTSMTFALRAGMMEGLGKEFGLSLEELGWMASMAFFGFPAATILGGLLYNSIGPKKIMIMAFLGHVVGLLMTIYSGGLWGLLVSTFLVGFANGAVEAGANPLIADLYPENRTTMLNKFHVWFPGGLVIGALAGYLIQRFVTGWESTWQLEIGIMLIPTIIYGYLVFTTKFPDIKKSSTLQTNTMDNIKALFAPLFIIMCVLMTITATTELGTNQWVGPLLENTGANALIVLAMVSTIMALGRYFAGPLVHALNPVGVLLFSAVFSALGIYLLSTASGNMVYLAAIVFAIGVCYFWPTMVGFVSEYLPKTGALGLSVIGGIGMMGAGMWQPVIGGWIDSAKLELAKPEMTKEAIDLAAGQATLGKILYFPLVLIAVFAILFFLRGKFMTRHAND